MITLSTQETKQYISRAYSGSFGALCISSNMLIKLKYFDRSSPFKTKNSNHTTNFSNRKKCYLKNYGYPFRSGRRPEQNQKFSPL